MTSARSEWEQVWIETAKTISNRSKCSRAQIGAVIVDAGQNVLASSYNGPPPGWKTPTDQCKDWCPRAQSQPSSGADYDSCPSSHAEINAIARTDHSRIRGATVYVTGSMCMNCAKAVAAAEIARVVHVVTESDSHRNPDLVEQFLEKCGITVKRIT